MLTIELIWDQLLGFSVPVHRSFEDCMNVDWKNFLQSDACKFAGWCNFFFQKTGLIDCVDFSFFLVDVNYFKIMYDCQTFFCLRCISVDAGALFWTLDKLAMIQRWLNCPLFNAGQPHHEYNSWITVTVYMEHKAGM